MLPIIEYGSEIWSAGNKLDIIDRFHVKYIKRILKLRPQTATSPVLGEVGEYPISMKLELRIIKHWIRLLNLSNDNMSKKIFIQLKSLDVIGFTAWVTHFRKLLEKYSLIDLFDLKYVPANFYKNIKISVTRYFHNNFLPSLQDDKSS